MQQMLNSEVPSPFLCIRNHLHHAEDDDALISDAMKSGNESRRGRTFLYTMYKFYQIDRGCHVSTAHIGIPNNYYKVKGLYKIDKICVIQDAVRHFSIDSKIMQALLHLSLFSRG